MSHAENAWREERRRMNEKSLQVEWIIQLMNGQPEPEVAGSVYLIVSSGQFTFVLGADHVKEIQMPAIHHESAREPKQKRNATKRRENQFSINETFV